MFDPIQLEKYEELTILKIESSGDKSILYIDFYGDTKKIVLERKSDLQFQKVFDFYFSLKKIDEKTDDFCVNKETKVDTKENVLRCWGFPNRIVKKGKDIEIWDFDLSNAGNNRTGFDISQLKFFGDKLINVGGII